MHISLAALAVVAALVAGYFLLRKVEPWPDFDGMSKEIEAALVASVGDFMAQEKARQGLHMTLEEFLGSFNFEQDALKVGLFTRKPDPTDESMASREEQMSAYRAMGASPGNAACAGCPGGCGTSGNTRHDALKSAQAQAQHEQLLSTPPEALRGRALVKFVSHPWSDDFIYAGKLLYSGGPLMDPVPVEQAEKVKAVLLRIASMLPYMAWTDRMMAVATELKADIWGVEYDPSILAEPAPVQAEAAQDAAPMPSLERGQEIVDEVNRCQVELDKAVATMIRELPANVVNRDNQLPHERETAIRVLREIVDTQPVHGLVQLCNVESWRVALGQKVDDSQLCDIEVGRIDSVRFVTSPFEPEADDEGASLPQFSAVERAYREGFTDGTMFEAPSVDRAWELSVAREQLVEANATQSQVQQTQAQDAGRAIQLREAITELIYAWQAEGNSPADCERRINARKEVERLALAESPQMVGLPVKEMPDLFPAEVHYFQFGEPVVPHAELQAMLTKLDEDRVKHLASQARAEGKTGYVVEYDGRLEFVESGRLIALKDDGMLLFRHEDPSLTVLAHIKEWVGSAPAETSSTRARPDSTASGIASSYPVAENAGLTSDSIDFGIERRYPFVSRFGRHDGKFGHEPAHDEGSQP